MLCDYGHIENVNRRVFRRHQLLVSPALLPQRPVQRRLPRHRRLRCLERKVAQEQPVQVLCFPVKVQQELLGSVWEEPQPQRRLVSVVHSLALFQPQGAQELLARLHLPSLVFLP